MRLRKLTHLRGACGPVALAVLAVVGAAAPAPARASTVLVVRPGETVQQTVDRAAPGDVVFVPAGVYRGSVDIRTDGVTLMGSGPATRFVPAAAAGNGACAAAGHGVCVTGSPGHPLAGVRLRSFSVSGFTKDGVMATWTDGLSVRGVVSRGNGEHGIRQDRSVRGVFRDNTAADNAETGIFLANTVTEEGGATDAEGAVVSGNRLSGNRVGITVRRLQDLVVERNTVIGNCAGIFVVGDEGTPRAGRLAVRSNRVWENNRYCPSTARLPVMQGAGIVLTGVEEVWVIGNDVRDNRGTSPLSGGIVLFPSFVGVASSRNTIGGNTATGNQPADVADRDKGTDNVFDDNRCEVSQPAGRC
ncbi:nitrous oxide reductase family maturation protein NosD [Streptomyces sp. NPDC001380]|uniref:right-handed parallel beta-helix repeat-containing protein n=1 Tax=Streptomyces sp. NPDC001380 TaxID=3364566 RepID=UPI00368D41D5